MAFTYRAGQTLSTNAGTFSSTTFEVVGGESIALSEPCPTGATVVTVGVDVSALLALGIKCTKDAVVTVNDDGSPTATINLTANEAIIWTADQAGVQFPTSNPLGATDVASMKVTVADDATLTFAALVDPTP
jgi:hypothetical protein